MTTKRKVEIFSAGCPVCEAAIARLRKLACASCEIVIVDTKEAAAAERAERLGVRSVPAVAIDGKLVDCCTGRGPDEAVLRAAARSVPRSSLSVERCSGTIPSLSAGSVPVSSSVSRRPCPGWNL